MRLRKVRRRGLLGSRIIRAAQRCRLVAAPCAPLELLYGLLWDPKGRYEVLRAMTAEEYMGLPRGQTTSFAPRSSHV